MPAEFFVHRHIYGKWACRCCQCLVQEAAPLQIIDGGMPATGLVVHTMISRFVDHVPYYRQEAINARSGVHTPRSTLASGSGRGGAALEPLFVAQKRFVLSTTGAACRRDAGGHAGPGRGQDQCEPTCGPMRAVPSMRCREWSTTSALGESRSTPSRSSARMMTKWPPRLERARWCETSTKAYEHVMAAEPGRVAAGCLAHARRKFDELLRDNGKSAVATEALQRIARIYRIERELATLTNKERLARSTAVAQPLWEELHKWLRLERARVHDGSATAKALNYSLNALQAR